MRLMRPERLELEGFTAFRDRVVIDFSDAELFALVGPTGSGKSSIVDAITFALYGSVPRLRKGRVEPIVSLGAERARVRFDFSVGEHSYTAARVVHRTKTGATTAEARLEGGPVDVVGAVELTEAVERLLGLSYEHFIKCVVLPQGEFASFLLDGPKGRQALLRELLDLGRFRTGARPRQAPSNDLPSHRRRARRTTRRSRRCHGNRTHRDRREARASPRGCRRRGCQSRDRVRARARSGRPPPRDRSARDAARRSDRGGGSVRRGGACGWGGRSLSRRRCCVGWSGGGDSPARGNPGPGRRVRRCVDRCRAPCDGRPSRRARWPDRDR